MHCRPVKYRHILLTDCSICFASARSLAGRHADFDVDQSALRSGTDRPLMFFLRVFFFRLQVYILEEICFSNLHLTQEMQRKLSKRQ